jgi:hypothetical protein
MSLQAPAGRLGWLAICRVYREYYERGLIQISGSG